MLLHYTPLIVSGVTCLVLGVQVALVLLLLGLVATRRTGAQEANQAAQPATTLPSVYVLSFMLVIVSDEDNKRAPDSERIGTGILKYGFKFLTCVDGTIDMVAILHGILEAYNASEIVILSLNPLPTGMRYNLPAQNIVDTRTLK